jgi:AraC family transcriptional regulator
MEFCPSPEMDKLIEFGGNRPGNVTEGMNLGICFQRDGTDIWSYAIAIELPEGKEAGKYDTVEIPASTWAVFETTLDDISITWRRILDEWFPSSGYEHVGTPEMEVYLPGDMSGSSVHQIWVPVMQKE